MCNSLNIIIKHHQHAQRPCASAPSAAETSSVRAGVFMCGSFPVGHGALRAERARAEGRLGRWREHALSGETKRKRAGEGMLLTSGQTRNSKERGGRSRVPWPCACPGHASQGRGQGVRANLQPPLGRGTHLTASPRCREPMRCRPTQAA